MMMLTLERLVYGGPGSLAEAVVILAQPAETLGRV
eukprot:COSAG06_NODE_507_length_14929_cov_109.047067_6_plen_35_part_00